MTSILHKRDLKSDPFEQFSLWFEDAGRADIALQNAMAVPSASRDGVPSVRMVLLKSFDDRGFVFYTHYDSEKGRQLQENPRAEFHFYWAPLDRQVRIRGTVEKTSREESETYFHSRPKESQWSAWASPQSEVVESRHKLEEMRAEIMKTYPEGTIPLPPFWGGFRLTPERFEFWSDGVHRYHDRFCYVREGASWTLSRMAP